MTVCGPSITVNNPPTDPRRLSIQNHGANCAKRGDQPLSAAVASSRTRNDGDRHGQADCEQGRRAMLSVPTLWLVFVVNFVALGLIWTYVARSYPNFTAAPMWTGSAFLAAAGAAVSMLRGILDSIVPLLAGGTMLIFACCLAATGARRFYGQDMSWRLTAAVTGLSFAGLTFFIAVVDHMPMRIFIYSLGMSVPMAMTLKLLLSKS